MDSAAVPLERSGLVRTGSFNFGAIADPLPGGGGIPISVMIADLEVVRNYSLPADTTAGALMARLASDLKFDESVYTLLIDGTVTPREKLVVDFHHGPPVTVIVDRADSVDASEAYIVLKVKCSAPTMSRPIRVRLSDTLEEVRRLACERMSLDPLQYGVRIQGGLAELESTVESCLLVDRDEVTLIYTSPSAGGNAPPLPPRRLVNDAAPVAASPVARRPPQPKVIPIVSPGELEYGRRSLKKAISITELNTAFDAMRAAEMAPVAPNEFTPPPMKGTGSRTELRTAPSPAPLVTTSTTTTTTTSAAAAPSPAAGGTAAPLTTETTASSRTSRSSSSSSSSTTSSSDDEAPAMPPRPDSPPPPPLPSKDPSVAGVVPVLGSEALGVELGAGDAANRSRAGSGEANATSPTDPSSPAKTPRDRHATIVASLTAANRSQLRRSPASSAASPVVNSRDRSMSTMTRDNVYEPTPSSSGARPVITAQDIKRQSNSIRGRRATEWLQVLNPRARSQSAKEPAKQNDDMFEAMVVAAKAPRRQVCDADIQELRAYRLGTSSKFEDVENTALRELGLLAVEAERLQALGQDQTRVFDLLNVINSRFAYMYYDLQ